MSEVLRFQFKATASVASSTTTTLATLGLTPGNGFPSGNFRFSVEAVVTGFTDDATDGSAYIDHETVVAAGRVQSGSIDHIAPLNNVSAAVSAMTVSNSVNGNVGNYRIDVSGTNLLFRITRGAAAPDNGASYTWFFDIVVRVV